MKTIQTFFKYTSLSMLSMIGMSCYILADTLFISNGVGTLGLTSLNLILPMYNVIFGVGLLIGVGAATRFSILVSQEKNKEADHYYSQAILLGILVSIPFVVIGFFFPEMVVKMLGANEEVLSTSIEYLRTFIVFTPFFILNQIVVTFVRNDHNPKLASIAMVAGTLFNIVFDYIFIFPCQLGMFGAALATGFSPIITLCICSLHFIYKNNNFHFIKSKLSFHHLKTIFSIGLPAFITELSGGVITFVFNMIILTIGGNIAVASYGIICNLAIVVTSLYTGIAQGIQPLLSRSYGRKEYHLIHDYTKYACFMSLILSCIIYLIMFIFPDSIVGLFNSENNMVMAKLAKEGLIIYFFAFFFVGLNMIAVSYFASTEKIKPSFIISILRGGSIVVPIVYILSNIFSLNGVWSAFPISELIVLIFTIILYKKYKLKKSSYDSAH
ncbi:MAG: MATE family efflux transporter [Coprobacillus sp.]